MLRKREEQQNPHSLYRCALCLVLCFPLVSFAQSQQTIDQAVREAERIQREQRDRLEQERREALQNRPHTGTVIEAPAVQIREDDDRCRDVNEIIIEGATLLSDSERDALTADALGTCMSVRDIEDLLSAILKYYVDRGYIAARTYLQPQDLASGILRILVVEGLVEKILLEDASGNRNVNRTTAFLGATGEPFNLRDFEQGLDQVNRLASNNALMDITPGEQPGGSVIVLRNEPSRRFRGSPSFDNYGSTSTGEWQVGAGISIDNPLALNDSFYYSHRRTTEGNIGSRHSRSHSFIYSVPLAYLTMTASHSFSDYATTIEAVGGNLVADGESKTTSLSAEYVVYRDAINRVALTGTLSAKTSNNFLDQQFLAVSSRKLSTFDLGASWNTRLLNGAFGLNANFVQGLRLFGALDDIDGLPDNLPHAQFSKVQFGASWYKPFAIGQQNFTFATTASGQVGIDVLFGSEQISIGNVYSVRGFRNTSISGDSGFFWRNDLGMPMPMELFNTALVLKPYLACDLGKIWDRHALEGGHLMGVSAGISLLASRFSVDVVGSKPVSVPSGLEDEGFQWFARISINL